MTMQDRFRFRVWDRKSKDLVESMSMCNFGFLTMQDGTDIEDSGFSADDLIIEQCTGLKDKKGNLIYEGDIIEDDNTKSDRGVVFFDKYSARFMVKMYKYNQKVLIKKNVRVVGNIHEEK